MNQKNIFIAPLFYSIYVNYLTFYWYYLLYYYR